MQWRRSDSEGVCAQSRSQAAERSCIAFILAVRTFRSAYGNLPYNEWMAHSPSNGELTADSRLEVRLNQSFKEEVEEAAAIQGISVSAFVLSTVLDAARRVRREYQSSRMDDVERDAFIDLLNHPSTPSEELIGLMQTKVVL